MRLCCSKYNLLFIT